jgi:hypothetical protein
MGRIMRNHLYAFSHTPRAQSIQKIYRGLTLPPRSAGAHLGLMQFVRVPVASGQLLCITSLSLTLLTHLQIRFFGTCTWTWTSVLWVVVVLVVSIVVIRLLLSFLYHSHIHFSFTIPFLLRNTYHYAVILICIPSRDHTTSFFL